MTSRPINLDWQLQNEDAVHRMTGDPCEQALRELRP